MGSIERDKSHIRFPLKKKRLTSKSEAVVQEKEEDSIAEQQAPSFIPELGELISNAEVLIRGKEFDLAKNLIGRSLQFYPKNLELLHLLAEVSVILQDWEMVEKSYTAIVQLDSNEENVIKLCETLQRLNKYDKARHYYQNLLAKTSVSEKNLFQIYKDLGNLCIRDSDLDSAEEYYNKAFSIDHYSDTLLVNFGTLELTKGNTETALNRFREALNVNPTNSQAWVGLALIHRDYADFDLSYANVNSALDHDPFNRSALKLYSDWSAAEGRSVNAIERLTEYLEKYDQDDEILLVYAKMLFVVGQIPMSILEAEKAFSLNPENNEAYEFLIIARQYIEGANSVD